MESVCVRHIVKETVPMESVCVRLCIHYNIIPVHYVHYLQCTCTCIQSVCNAWLTRGEWGGGVTHQSLVKILKLVGEVRELSGRAVHVDETRPIGGRKT